MKPSLRRYLGMGVRKGLFYLKCAERWKAKAHRTIKKALPDGRAFYTKGECADYFSSTIRAVVIPAEVLRCA